MNASGTECTELAARELSNRHMAAALSADCHGRLRAIAAPEGWIRNCQEARPGLEAAEHSALTARTSFEFTALHRVDGVWLAEGVLRRPDPLTLDARLLDRLLCGGTSMSPPGENDCGPLDVSSIALVDEKATVPLECRTGRWQVPDIGEDGAILHREPRD